MEVRLGHVLIGQDPRVVGTILRAATLNAWRGLVEAGCDIVELRLDETGVQARDWLARCKTIEAAGWPVIFTLRLAAEGGQWRRPDEERAGYFTTALDNLAAIDLELQSRLLPKLTRQARAARKPVIVSFHDFTKTPSANALRDIILEASRHAAIVKITTMITRLHDLMVLRGLLEQDWGVPLSVMGMGPEGMKTRAEFARHGSCLTYGYLDEAAVTGQPSAAELFHQLHA